MPFSFLAFPKFVFFSLLQFAIEHHIYFLQIFNVWNIGLRFSNLNNFEDGLKIALLGSSFSDFMCMLCVRVFHVCDFGPAKS